MTARPFRTVATLLLTGVVTLAPASAFARGTTGHDFVSEIAAELLPEEIPAVVRTLQAVADVAVLAANSIGPNAPPQPTTRSATSAISSTSTTPVW